MLRYREGKKDIKKISCIMQKFAQSFLGKMVALTDLKTRSVVVA